MATKIVWRKDVGKESFLISTSQEKLDLGFINRAFASDDMYWAKELPIETLRLMLSQSQTLGLYRVLPAVAPPASVSEPSTPRTPSPTLEEEPHESLEQVGLARLVTDFVSTAYLTDVYVLPEYRKGGLGKWLISACRQLIDEMPALRRAILMASPGVGTTFYARELGFWDIHDEREHLVAMTRKNF